MWSTPTPASAYADHLPQQQLQYQQSSAVAHSTNAGPSHHHHHHQHQQHQHQSHHHHNRTPSFDNYAPSRADHVHASGSTQGYLSQPGYGEVEQTLPVSFQPFSYSSDPARYYAQHPQRNDYPSVSTESPSFRTPHPITPIIATPLPPVHSAHWIPPQQTHDTSWHTRPSVPGPTWQTDNDVVPIPGGDYYTPPQNGEQLPRPPLRVPTKGKGREADNAWAQDEERELKRSRRSSDAAVNVELDIAQLQTNLTELLGYIHPFVPSSDQPSPAPPPPYLHTRFTKLSDMIHASLLRLAPYVHASLLPGFTITPPNKSKSPTEFPALPSRLPPPTKKFEDMTPAEKEMEIIRRRRDALIAKAASALAAHGPQSALSPATGTSASKSDTPHVPSPRRQMSGSTPLGHGNGLFQSKGVNGLENGSLGNLAALTAASELASKAQMNPGLDRLPLDSLSPRSMALIGRCHGCGASVTNGWRQGPDGPESLCEPCGMHYAKLLAKKDMPMNPVFLPVDGGVYTNVR